MKKSVISIIVFCGFLVSTFVISPPALLKNNQSSPGAGLLIPANPPGAQYFIEAKIDLQARELTGQEKIVFRNNSRQRMSTIALDGAALGAGRTLELLINGKILEPIRDQNSPSVFYVLLEPLKPKARLEITAKFSLKLGENTEIIQLLGWHPRLWWEGIPTRDSYKVKLEIPPGYAAAVSGHLNTKSGYYENACVTTRFAAYLARDMILAQKEAEGVLITALFTKEGEQCARFCLEKAAEIIAFYKKWLGFYPSQSLYIIPGASRPMGGYPYAAGIVVIHGQENFASMPPLHWEWITAHEIGHQYWGEYVMSDDHPYSYINSWLMISLGIWADLRYVLSKKLSYEKHLAFLNRYLEGVEKRYDTTADAPFSLFKRQNFDRNNIIIHGKGFSILSALESVLGEETFEGVYKRCLKDFGGKRLGYREFWRICEEESGQSLDWFFEQWVRSNRYLCYQATFQESVKEGDRYVSYVHVEASPDSIQMPIPVQAIFADGSTQLQSTNRFLKVNRLKFESQAELKEVRLDPEHKLAMIRTPLAILPEELAEMIAKLPWEGSGKDALKVFQAARDAKMDIPDLWFFLGLKLIDGKYYEEAAESFAKIIELKKTDFNALVWIGHLKDLVGERKSALEYYQKALRANPQGTGIRHDQWGIVLDRKWVEERLKTPFEFKKK